MSSKVDCGICAEDNVLSGMICECKNDMCIQCQSKMEKCPFCRRPFPNLIARIAQIGATEEVLQVYSDEIKEAANRVELRHKKCHVMAAILEVVDYDPEEFEMLAVNSIGNDSHLYVKLIGFLEEELLEAAKSGNWSKVAAIEELISEYHHSAEKLDDLMDATDKIQDEQQKEWALQYQRDIIVGRKAKKRSSRGATVNRKPVKAYRRC